jgi:hypothetical protein
LVSTSAHTRHAARLGEDLLRSRPPLHPVHERVEEVLRLRPGTAAAVPHSRRPEQTVERQADAHVDDRTSTWQYALVDPLAAMMPVRVLRYEA